eukprot:gnl/Dysnectes_brevis/3481_a4414_1306.p1 GENE.gnl/Dysnectes_brevis/3481_a4414_1306~~gnl/Dysnectes_brevis/3481_a4414_1306.p1  ORF type:complete len:253 (+),score=87.64 gnl/Dysnectes_brevis/3481_a4414_1306:50-808(+)
MRRTLILNQMPESFVTIHGAEVPITLPEGVSVDILKTYVPFQDWISELDHEIVIDAITVQGIDMFGPRIGFLKFKTAARSRTHGNRIPGIVFMRGGAVAILIVLKCNGELYTLLTSQARIPAGRARFLEVPAGMVDGSGNVKGVAIKEIEEETGIVIKSEDLTELSAGVGSQMPGAPVRGVYTSPGGSDEWLKLYCMEKEISKEELVTMQGQVHGVDEHERITLEIAPLTSLPSMCPDAKSLACWALYQARM